MLDKNSKLKDGFNETEAATYLQNSAGRSGKQATPEQLAAEALLAQDKKVNVRHLANAGVSKQSRVSVVKQAKDQIAKLDNIKPLEQKGLNRALKNAEEHVGALGTARTLLTMRGRAPSFTPGKGGKTGIAPIGESPPVTRHMVEGDVTHLKSVMDGSGYKPTQNYVHYQKVNSYAQDMLNDKFDWAKLSREKPGDVVRIGVDDTIQHGHHRVVAAQIVSKLTGRPLINASNAIIPDGHWIRVSENLKPSRAPDWNGVGVKTMEKGLEPPPLPPSARGPRQ